MRMQHCVRGFVAVLSLCLSPLLDAAIQLTPVVSGLSSPVFVANAGDGTNRLFIVEQAGVVRVLQPGASTPTTFLDIQAKVVAGGEQGLLGLAFHPEYSANGRFFVYYTRIGDGTLVIAEYRVSDDPNVAGTGEIVLLTIPHPTNRNHNGGMLAFGPDRHLYIGVGDGGAGNDPPGNAQNIDVLLGKILRIDVDHADPVAGTVYSPPADNPFVNAPGRDEIFALGMRNPWRFSFDHVTGVQWVADVGQGVREEVDMPIVRGGNYGWRIYEGFGCTGNDPALCDPASYRPPIFDYAHSSDRCSITGGYVYRGAAGALPRRHVCLRRLLFRRDPGVGRHRAKRPARHVAQRLVVRRGRAGRTVCRRSRRNREQDRSRRTALHLRNLAGARNVCDEWRRRDRCGHDGAGMHVDRGEQCLVDHDQRRNGRTRRGDGHVCGRAVHRGAESPQRNAYDRGQVLRRPANEVASPSPPRSELPPLIEATSSPERAKPAVSARVRAKQPGYEAAMASMRSWRCSTSGNSSGSPPLR